MFDILIISALVGVLAYLAAQYVEARHLDKDFNAKIDAEVAHLKGLLANVQIGTLEYDQITRWVHSLLTSRR